MGLIIAEVTQSKLVVATAARVLYKNFMNSIE
jgi:hypothetical protein